MQLSEAMSSSEELYDVLQFSSFFPVSSRLPIGGSMAILLASFLFLFLFVFQGNGRFSKVR